jgi:hypothetical protein
MLIANSAHITKAGNAAKLFPQEFRKPFGQGRTFIEKRTQGIAEFGTSGNQFNYQTRAK